MTSSAESLVSAQVYALICEKVRRGPEDLIHAVLGQDPDQCAVHVEGDRSNIHALLSALLARLLRHGAVIVTLTSALSVSR